MEDFERKVGM